jgi:hypothetical protein
LIDDDDDDFLEQLVERIWQGKTKYSEETCPGATLSTTKSHMMTRSRTPDRSGGKPATNRLSYGATHIQHVIENSFFCTTRKSSVSTGFTEQIMPVLGILMLQWQLSHLNILKLDHAMIKPLIFSMFGFTLSYIASISILMIVYDFCLLPLQFCGIIIYIRMVECVQIAEHCAPWLNVCANSGALCTLENFQWCAEPCFACTAVLRGRCVLLIFRQDKRMSLLI